MKKNNKIIILTISIIILFLYAISICFLLNKSNDNEIIQKNIYSIYMLKNDKEKYEKVTNDDLIKIDICNVSEITSNDSVSQIQNEEFNVNDSAILFKEDEVLNTELLSCNLYTTCELKTGELICKDKILNYDEVIKEKILNYSFLGYVSYEVPYVKKINNDIQIGIDIQEKDSYLEILKKFILSNDLDVHVFIQNKNDFSISKILDNVKLIYIDEDKAILCLLPDEAKTLKEYMDTYNILISEENELDTEVYVFE